MSVGGGNLKSVDWDIVDAIPGEFFTNLIVPVVFKEFLKICMRYRAITSLPSKFHSWDTTLKRTVSTPFMFDLKKIKYGSILSASCRNTTIQK